MAARLKVAIVGVAGRGGAHASSLGAHPDCTLEAFCDVNEEGLKQAADRWGVQQTFTELERMLDEAHPDALVVGTPMHLHFEHCRAALDRGIHVLSEVPATVSLEESRKLVECVRKSNGRYMMAENACYFVHNMLVRELARRGLFGKLYFSEAHYVHELKAHGEDTSWRRKWQTGVNGCTYGTHCLGPVLQWFEGQRVAEVCCVGSGHHYRDPRGDLYELEDTTTTLCRMSGGGLVQVRLDMLSDRPHRFLYFELQGTGGCYISEHESGQPHLIWLSEYGDSPREWREIDEDFMATYLPADVVSPPEAAKRAGHGGSDYYVATDFVDALLNDHEMPIGIDEAMDMTLPGLVSQKSIEAGSVWLPVPDSRQW